MPRTVQSPVVRAAATSHLPGGPQCPTPTTRTAPPHLVRKKSELTPERYAHQRKMLIVSGAIMVVCIAAIVGILNLIG